MDLEEAEFIAENAVVLVIPNFKEGKLYLLRGEFGPFNPGLPTEVPLWVAIHLKQKQKCRISPPEWMDVEKLKEVKDLETNSDLFTTPPSDYYMEISSVLLNSAADDIPHADEIKTLVKDIWDIRVAKLRKGIEQMVARQETHAQLDNLTVMEINSVRPVLTKSLEFMHKMRSIVVQLPAVSSSASGP